ncbi:hypothetical protein Bbelb_016660 [Branchiostoma belcheri]|nr:hypothetical protein Bbelb_016660 [Branchiostoma belcheri]
MPHVKHCLQIGGFLANRARTNATKSLPYLPGSPLQAEVGVRGKIVRDLADLGDKTQLEALVAPGLAVDDSGQCATTLQVTSWLRQPYVNVVLQFGEKALEATATPSTCRVVSRRFPDVRRFLLCGNACFRL